jgi:tRNA G18 (ribose-2'-O)-methylase SpoU
MQQLGHDQSTQRTAKRPNRPLTLVLVDVETPMNVAHAFRLADGVGAQVLLVGASATPADLPRLRNLARQRTDTVPWRHISTADLCAELHVLGARPVVIEVTRRSLPYAELALGQGAPLSLVVGGERHGVPEPILEAIHDHVHVPMAGVGSSYNVAMALAVVAAHYAFVAP